MPTRKPALAAARHVEAQTSIRAPIAGTVYSWTPRPPNMSKRAMLLQMADLSKERVRAYFDEPDLGRLAVGQKVAIRGTLSRARNGTATSRAFR